MLRVPQSSQVVSFFADNSCCHYLNICATVPALAACLSTSVIRPLLGSLGITFANSPLKYSRSMHSKLLIKSTPVRRYVEHAMCGRVATAATAMSAIITLIVVGAL
jgi:hypothetical protein